MIKKIENLKKTYNLLFYKLDTQIPSYSKKFNLTYAWFVQKNLRLTKKLARVGCNNQRALRRVHMIYKHNIFVGLFGVSYAVHGFYFGCRNALGLIATYYVRSTLINLYSQLAT